MYWMRVTPNGTFGKNTLFIIAQIIKNLDSFFAQKLTTLSKKSIRSISGTSKKSITNFVTAGLTPEQQAKHQRSIHAIIDYILTTQKIQEEIEPAQKTLTSIVDYSGNPVTLSDTEREFFVLFYLANCIRNNTDITIEKYGLNIATVENINVLIILFHAFFERIIQITLSSKINKNTKKYMLTLILLMQKIEKINQQEQTKMLIQYVKKGFKFTQIYLQYLEEQTTELNLEIKQKIITDKKRLLKLLKNIIFNHPLFKKTFPQKIQQNRTNIVTGLQSKIGIPGLISNIKITR